MAYHSQLHLCFWTECNSVVGLSADKKHIWRKLKLGGARSWGTVVQGCTLTPRDGGSVVILMTMQPMVVGARQFFPCPECMHLGSLH